MVRKQDTTQPKASEKKWKSKQTPATQEQINKIIEESKQIAAQATQRALEAIQAQGIMDPDASLPSNLTSIFENTPVRGSNEHMESTGLTGAVKRLSFIDHAIMEDSASKRNKHSEDKYVTLSNTPNKYILLPQIEYHTKIFVFLLPTNSLI